MGHAPLEPHGLTTHSTSTHWTIYDDDLASDTPPPRNDADSVSSNHASLNFTELESGKVWTEVNIAQELWKDPTTQISSTMVCKVNCVHNYLDSIGYQLEGILADGDCFISAYLKSYKQLVDSAIKVGDEWRIPILDDQDEQKIYLRELIAGEYLNRADIITITHSERAETIKKSTHWISGIEGDLLVRALKLPIRQVTVNGDHDQCGYSDMITRAGEEAEEWDQLPIDQRPERFIFIVDLGGHFVYARKKNHEGKTVKSVSVWLKTLNSNMSPSPQGTSDGEASYSNGISGHILDGNEDARLIPPTLKNNKKRVKQTASKSSTIGSESLSQKESAGIVPLTFDEIKESLEHRLREIEGLGESYDEVFSSLMEKAGDKTELREKLRSIKELELEAQEARKEYVKYYQEYESLKTSLIATAHFLGRLLRRYANSYEYLEGPGQHDEYESNTTEELKECKDEFRNLLHLAEKANSNPVELLNPNELLAFATDCEQLVEELITLPSEDYMKRVENIRLLKKRSSTFEPFLRYHQIEVAGSADDNNFQIMNTPALNEEPPEDKVEDVVLSFLFWLKHFLEDRASPRAIKEALSSKELCSFLDPFIPFEEESEEEEYKRQFQALRQVLDELDEQAQCLGLNKDELSNLRQFAFEGEELIEPLVPLKENMNIQDQIGVLQTLFSTFSGIQDILSPHYNPTEEELIIDEVIGFCMWFDKRLQNSEQGNDLTIHLAQRAVFNALDDYQNCEDAKSIMKKFNRSKKKLTELLVFLSEQISDPDANSEALPQKDEIDRSLKKFISVSELIAEAIASEIESYADLRYDEWDSNTLFVNKVLEKEEEKFSSVAAQCQEFQAQLTGCLARLNSYSELTDQLEASSQKSIEAQLKLIQALNDLNGKNKKTSSADISKKLSAISIAEGLQKETDLLLNLARQRRLSDEEKNSDQKKFQSQKKAFEEEIIRLATEGNDPLDTFIEWTLVNKKLIKLHDALVVKKTETAKLFPHTLIENILEAKEDHVIVHCSHTTGSIPQFVGMRSHRTHPLDSPLAHLVSSLSIQGLPYSGYKGFLHLSEQALTSFEQGLLKVVGKSEEKVATKPIYLNLDHSSSSQPSRRGAPLTIATPSIPNYYRKFNLPPSSPNTFSDSTPPVSSFFIKKIYTLLVMSLAHSFLNDDLRRNSGLPGGNPIASLVISNKGEILSWAVNTNGGAESDTIRHAEVNALSIYFLNNPSMSNLPKGSYVFTSLKSCHMCAGAIHDSMVEHNDVQVIYCQNDPRQIGTAIEGLEQQAEFKKSEENLLKKIDQKYTQIKQGKKTLNAAESLTEPELQAISIEFVNELRTILASNEGTDEEKACLQYIQSFLDANSLIL